MYNWKMIVSLTEDGRFSKLPDYYLQQNNWFHKFIKDHPIIVGKNTLSLLKDFNHNVLLEVSSESPQREYSFVSLDLVQSFIDIQLPTAVPFVIGGKHLYNTSLFYCDTIIIYKDKNSNLEEEIFSFNRGDFPLEFEISEDILCLSKLEDFELLKTLKELIIRR